jgi:hypothetical protein
MYISFDDGANWQSMQFNLPVVPITDLVIQKREKELVAATQGRAFWIFDDLPMLHQMMDAGGFGAASATKLFKPKEAYRMPGGGGFNLPATATIGKNPASGVVVYYSLKAKPTTDLVLEFLDANGKPSTNLRRGCRDRALKARRKRSNRKRVVARKAAFLVAARRRVRQPTWD